MAAASPRLRLALCAALFLGTALLFARACGNDFVNYDDPDYVTANAHVRGGLTLAGVQWALTSGEASNWHPLTWLSHMLDSSLFGSDPRGHHATSVVLHAANAALAFLALLALSGALWPSLLCAALFAWHPLRVESVAWVAERKDVLSGLFFFATLWAYAGWVRRKRGYALVLLAFALGLTAKPMLITLPFVLLLLDWWPLRRFASEPVQRLVLEKAPLFALSLASAIVTYLAQERGGSVAIELPLDARIANAAVSVPRYLGKLVWPFDLAVLYPHPGRWPAPAVLAGTALLAAGFALAWTQRVRRPWLTVGWLWFVGMLVPVIGIVQVGLQSLADRYTYLPMLGVQIALLWTLREHVVTPRARRTATIAAALVLIACAARTWDQIGAWRNSFTLFDHAIAATDGNYLAHNNRGAFLREAGRLDEALADYRRALAIEPGYAKANNNLGRLLTQQGKAADALPLLRAAVAAQPRLLEARDNLAIALSALGMHDEALAEYDAILAIAPNDAEALANSGIVLARQRRLAEARARLEAAVRLRPDHYGAHGNLGNVLAALGSTAEAIRHYRQAAAIQPRDPRMHHNIAAVFSSAGQLEQAATSYERALALAPDNVETRAVLGHTYARLGRREDALRELRAALAQRPDYAQAREWLQQASEMK
jgi:Flp pilus assembly protein TadD